MGILVKRHWVFLLGMGLAMGARAEDSTGVRFEEFRAGADLEFGQIVKGENRNAGLTFPLNDIGMYRNIVFLEQNATYGDSWEFNLGLKGILWWPFSPQQTVPVTRTIRVEPRPSIAKIKKLFGPGDESHYLEAGYFPYKYNPDARNLGEYLYRSGTYPGVISNGDGYHLINNAYFEAYGLHFHYSSFGDRLSQDINLFSELMTYPIGDITPGYEISWNGSLLKFGIGAAYNRGISFNPSKTRPRKKENTYIEAQANPTKGTPYYKGPYSGAPAAIQGDTTDPYQVLHTWGLQGIKLMARAAVDLGFLIPERVRGPEDLRLFGEVGVLGVEDQPYYYEKLTERMPVMAGFNLPTLQLLDVISLQVEYYSSPFNGIKAYTESSLPIWTVQDYQTRDADALKVNKWKWSAYASKQLNRLLKLNAQVANDHLRLRTFDASLSQYDLTQSPNNWYYLVNMEMSL